MAFNSSFISCYLLLMEQYKWKIPFYVSRVKLFSEFLIMDCIFNVFTKFESLHRAYNKSILAIWNCWIFVLCVIGIVIQVGKLFEAVFLFVCFFVCLFACLPVCLFLFCFNLFVCFFGLFCLFVCFVLFCFLNGFVLFVFCLFLFCFVLFCFSCFYFFFLFFVSMIITFN